jgi:hypothetical protein
MSEELQVAEAPVNRSVLTSENASEFYANKLGLAAEAPAEAEETSEPAPEADVESEPEAEKEATEERKPNPKLEKRFSELTKQREAARQEAQREREAREALEARLQALEKSSQPQQASEQPDEEPQPHQFSDAFEYAKALAEFTAEKALKERDKQEAQRKADEEKQKVMTVWAQKVEAAKAELPDFDDMIQSSDVVVNDAVRDAILESDVGPQLLYHLAENPEIAEKLSTSSVSSALRQLGKLEAKLEKVVETQPETKPSKPVAKKSNAPEPIKPLRGASVATDVPMDSDGQFHGTFAQWKAARLAGKIR